MTVPVNPGQSPIDESSLAGRDCYGGLDLSTTTDVSALVLLFPEVDGGMTVVPRFWIPADNALQRDGFEVVTFGQGFRDMSAPTKEWEKLTMCGKLRHGNHPVLRWMASNVAVETDAAGNVKPSKKKSTERIDGIVAGIMALGRATLRQEQGSVYKTRGLLIL